MEACIHDSCPLIHRMPIHPPLDRPNTLTLNETAAEILLRTDLRVSRVNDMKIWIAADIRVLVGLTDVICRI